jgi:hypothetical protein
MSELTNYWHTSKAKVRHFDDLLHALEHALTCKTPRNECDECLNAQLVATLAGLIRKAEQEEEAA